MANGRRTGRTAHCNDDTTTNTTPRRAFHACVQLCRSRGVCFEAAVRVFSLTPRVVDLHRCRSIAANLAADCALRSLRSLVSGGVPTGMRAALHLNAFERARRQSAPAVSVPRTPIIEQRAPNAHAPIKWRFVASHTHKIFQLRAAHRFHFHSISAVVRIVAVRSFVHIRLVLETLAKCPQTGGYSSIGSD